MELEVQPITLESPAHISQSEDVRQLRKSIKGPHLPVVIRWQSGKLDHSPPALCYCWYCESCCKVSIVRSSLSNECIGVRGPKQSLHPCHVGAFPKSGVSDSEDTSLGRQRCKKRSTNTPDKLLRDEHSKWGLRMKHLSRKIYGQPIAFTIYYASQL